MISHDTDLLDALVNKVFHLDADRAVIDIYNVGWKTYLEQRETDARRRRRERVNAERQAATLHAQADKMRAKATKAKAAQNMAKRAEKLLAGVSADRQADRVAKLRFPEPAHCGKVPLTAAGPVQVVRLARGVHRRRHGGRQGRADRRARPERRRQDHAAAAARRRRAAPIPARCGPATGCGSAITRRSTRRSTIARTVLENMKTAAPRPHRGRSARHSRVVPVLRRRRGQAGRRAVRRREDQARAGPARGLRRERAAARRADQQPGPGQQGRDPDRAAPVQRGAIVLVTHDEGAVEALGPERVLLLPDGVEDLWSAELADLVALA